MSLNNPPGVGARPGDKYSILHWVLGGLFLSLLACNVGFPLVNRPTPTADLTEFEVQVQIIASPTPSLPEPLPTPVIIAIETPALIQGVVATEVLQTSPTIFARPTSTPVQPIVVVTSTNTLISNAAVGEGIYTGNITGQIVSVDPAPGYLLPEEMDQLEVKWQWLGTEARPCQLLDGYGFDVRVWPSATNPQLSEAQRQEITPLGVLDAVADQQKIVDGCDPRTGIRRYTINYLKSVPGVLPSGGSGQFFWDVAYVQLEPYYVPLMVSAPRDFFIPPSEAEERTPTATPAATPTFQLTPGPRPAGIITLIAPEGKPTFPANIGPVEFRWKWEGDGSPCNLVMGYGFEIRIGSTRPGFSPLGVFDARISQDKLSCDPGTGIYSYTVPDLKSVPGVRATFVGEYRWDGQFAWYVTLVSVNPYQDPGPETASELHHFEISLSDYTGAFDPFGEPLTCKKFAGWTEAQAVFLAAGGPGKDPHKLDKDGNQIACDELRQ